MGIGLLLFFVGMNRVCWVLVCRFRSGWVVAQLLVLCLWVPIGMRWWCVCWVWVWVWVYRVPISYEIEVLGLGLWGRFWLEWSDLGFAGLGLKNLLELVGGNERNSVWNSSPLSSISMWPNQGTWVCCAQVTIAKLTLTNWRC